MEYREFKEKVLGALKEFYGNSADVELGGALKNNGRWQDAVHIRMHNRDSSVIPVIYLEEYFRMYSAGEMGIGECVKNITGMMEREVCLPQFTQVLGRLCDWESVRKKVYPALVSTEKNRELLGKLVSESLLDMSVIYIIREKTDKGTCCSIKINHALMRKYGISRGQLHEQAMCNLRKDGYGIMEVGEYVRQKITGRGNIDWQGSDGMEEGKMYILSNKPMLYGAAGILDAKMIQDITKERDCFILPSSIHETIILPVSDGLDQKELDSTVAEVNRTCVGEEERLTDHSYYYDAMAAEIRISA